MLRCYVCMGLKHCFAIFLGTFFSAVSFAEPNDVSRSTILIEGDDKFVLQVQLCLDLLEKKSKKEYRLITKHIGVISQNEKSGMLAWATPPRFQLSKKTAFYSLTWCAGAIAHDAYHSFLYQKHLPENGKPTLRRKWAGFASEKKAIKFQLRVMEKIGASAGELNYLKSQDGLHGDINGDGKLTKEDYDKRDW